MRGKKVEEKREKEEKICLVVSLKRKWKKIKLKLFSPLDFHVTLQFSARLEKKEKTCGSHPFFTSLHFLPIPNKGKLIFPFFCPSFFFSSFSHQIKRSVRVHLHRLFFFLRNILIFKIKCFKIMWLNKPLKKVKVAKKIYIVMFFKKLQFVTF